MKVKWLLVLMCVFCANVAAQTCDHTSNSEERFANMRILPPVKVLDWDGRHIEYSFIDKGIIYLTPSNKSAIF